jgi:electron transport complex protein RnfG
MSKIKFFLEQSWLLLISAFFFGLLIATANSAWSPRIEQNKKDKLTNLMKGLITTASHFEPALQEVEITGAKGQKQTTTVYKGINDDEATSGFAFIASGFGFADKIELVIAVDAKCEKLYGYKVLFSNETPGFGDKIKNAYFSDQFKGAPVGKFELVKSGDPLTIDDKIVAISGATVTSTAMVNIFNTCIEQIKERLEQKGLLDNGK